jgi:hypothetical protein
MLFHPGKQGGMIMNNAGHGLPGPFLMMLLAALSFVVILSDVHAWQDRSPLVLTDGQDTYPLVDHAEVYVDQSAALTFDQINSEDFDGQFRPAGEVNTSSQESAYWIRFEMENRAAPATSWLLVYDVYNVNQISAFIPDSRGTGFREIHTGNTFPFSSRDFEYHYYVFELKTPSGEKDTIYLRLYDVAGIRLAPL